MYKFSLRKSIPVLLLLLVISSRDSYAQTCGFGCFGLGGFYVGFGVQKYEAPGLNDYVKKYNREHSSTITKKMDEFGQATGFRLGANLFRTKYRRFMFSAKGYYQFLKEEKSSDEIVDNKELKNTYSLNFNYWGVGVDIGYSIFSFVDWKIVDAALTFHSAELNIQKTPAGLEPDIQMSGEKTVLGYSLGSGFVIRLVGDYVSIEATASYSKFSIESVKGDNNTGIVGNETGDSKFIDDGGLGAAVQLNIGIPLY
ncbi:MAG: hypothetical protein ACM3SM_08055 [Bacteroidota bacterium]